MTTLMQRVRTPIEGRCHVVVAAEGVGFRQCGNKADGSYVLPLPLQGRGVSDVEPVPVCPTHYRRPAQARQRAQESRAREQVYRERRAEAFRLAARFDGLGVSAEPRYDHMANAYAGVGLSSTTAERVLAVLREVQALAATDIHHVMHAPLLDAWNALQGPSAKEG